MITFGPELDKFVVEPFDSKLIKEIFLNHPYKFLLYSFNKKPPYYSNWKNIDITDYYFKMLDDYNRYGISFNRELNLFPDNNLYVIKNEDEDFEKGKYILLFSSNHYDKKTLLFNKVKKIDLNKHDSGKKPISKKEKQKRNFIKEQINKYLQIAMMDPDVYNNDKLFKDLMRESHDYNHYILFKFPMIHIDYYNNDKRFKEEFKKTNKFDKK